jgi:asparagine synthase (glutamine-hydrolysing)
MRAELTARGESFASKSDSEIVLALYRRHGLRFVEHLRGEYAIALLDRQRMRLVLARDRFGVRPLLYHANHRRVVWASEAKAILAHPEVGSSLCRRAAISQLAQVMVPGTTAFEGVQALQPGHLLVVESGESGLRIRQHKYWDLSFPAVGERAAAEPQQHIDAVRSAVVDALSVRAEADTQVGLYLSGGMDSGSLLGLASSYLQQQPKAFSIAFDDEAYDESGIAARVAQAAGAPLVTCPVGDDELYGDHYVKAVWHSERTFYNTLGVAKMALSAQVNRHGFRAVLSGEGADELFAGYRAFAVDAPGGANGTLGAAPDHDALFLGAILTPTPQQHPAFERICGFTPGWVQPWVATWRRVRSLLSEGLLRELGDYDPLEAVAESFDRSLIEGRQRLDVAQYTWIKTMLDGQILSWGGDRVDMANAVECRPVFLDHRLAEVAAAVPPELRINQGREKWVLREALRFAMPEFLYARRKFAFMAPPAHRSRARAGKVEALADRFLSAEKVARAGICDPGRVREFMRSIATGDDPALANDNDKICNHLLSLHVLHELFIA